MNHSNWIGLIRVRTFLVATVSFGFVLAAAGSSIFAQQKHVGAPGNLAADVVFLKDKSILYGVAHESNRQNLTLVVERAWLHDNHPEKYREAVARELQLLKKIHQDRIQRIEDWLANSKDEVNLQLFLEDEKAAAEQRLAVADQTTKRFMFLAIPRDQIRKQVIQEDADRQMMLLAWKYHIKDAIVTGKADLAKQLRNVRGGVRNEVVDFTNEIPALTDAPENWAVRQSIVEFVLCDSLEFQGTGDLFFRRGEKPAMATLMKQMMEQGGVSDLQRIGEELGLPEFTRNKKQREDEAGDWWKKQAGIAEKEGFRVFSITRLSQDIADSNVEVDVFLIGKDSNHQWRLIRQFKGTADSSKQSDRDVEALMQDPQVEKIIELAKALGADAKLKKALQHGVATQVAIQEGLNKLSEFTDKYSQSLSSPELPMDRSN